MDDARIYTKLANDCLERAKVSSDPRAADGLIRLGLHWVSRARQAEQHVAYGQRDDSAVLNTTLRTNRNRSPVDAVPDADGVSSLMSALALSNGPLPRSTQ